MMAVDYSMLPEHMREAARCWVDDGIMASSFLTAVMTNNLTRAFGYADEKNGAAIERWVQWLCWEIPGVCWGSPEKVAAWRKAKQEERES
jgi:hypothetical protein